MIRILKTEVYKILHQRKLAFAILALGAFSFLLQVGFRFQGRNPLTAIAKRGDFNLELLLNSINTTRLILNSCYYLFLPILAAMIFSGQIAGERSGGTLVGILSRPVSRVQLYLSKFLVSTLILQMIILFFVMFTLIVGSILFGAHDFLSSPRIFDLFSNDDLALVLPFETGVARLVVTAFMLTFLLLPTGAIALYFSLLFKNTHTAMGITLFVFFGCYILQGLGNIELFSLFSSIKPYLFTTAMESWVYIFYPEIAWGEILPRFALLLIYTVSLLAAGLIHFTYLDLSD